MSRTIGELARVSSAFEQPTLSLLHQRQAPVVVTILNACFSREIRLVPTARLHVLVEGMLAEMATSGMADVPTGSGREVCLRWTRAQWLIRSTASDGSEVYSLTSHAQQSLDFIANLRQERTGLSEHRIANIVATARRINRESNPDRLSRIAILDAEITQLTVERDRLQAGGEIEAMSEDRMLEGFDELLSLVSQLPSDFKRVEEAFRTVRGEILDDFRAERRVPGEVIDRYLERIDQLITATPEGRAFDGAFALLRDDDLLDQLRKDVGALIEQGESFLMDRDRKDLRGIVPLLRQGLDSVLDQRSRITDVLRTYITTRDAAKDRELDRVLRSLEGAVSTWLGMAGPRETVPVSLLPGEMQVEHLRERFYDPSDDVPLPQMPEGDDEQPEALSIDELRRYGGPRMAELHAALLEAKARPGGWSLGELFSELPSELRRPVDVLGLLHLATNSDELMRTDDAETYFAIRPDGSTRMFEVPQLTPGSGPEEENL
ncbi:DUF3375 domain-containing protein [Leifsonia sp. NPDC058230]|uniref:DUF3375 domain-containing protein n=1 Tax=Leifsonia sp. NPDC058230 TaxID=3346391 RepID=UPI0036DD9A7C